MGGGPKARFNRNRRAIETYRELAESNRTPTLEELDAIAAYMGWGSFGQELFQGNWDNPRPASGWEKEDEWLRDHLGKSEWESAQRSIINAHYTDPPTVSAMWALVRALGFKGGRLLEPSMGIGNFFGLMPRDLAALSQLTGIELDELTGGMAKMLYPQANIRIMGYEKSKTPDDFYDVVIGNWPFFEQGPPDRRYDAMGLTLHDYFFVKALDQTRPGGLVIGLTSSGTMDKKGTRARAEMAKRGDLVASFRLPTGAFEKYAGTKVVTDLIILRKRETPRPSGELAQSGWLNLATVPTPYGVDIEVNEYYARNPSHVLGTLNYGRGTTIGRMGMIVDRPDNLLERLQNLPSLLPEGMGMTDPPRREQNSYVTNNTQDRQGSVTDQDGKLYVVTGEHLRPLEEVVKYAVKSEKTTKAREAQMTGLIGIRRALGTVLDAQRRNDEQTEQLRRDLRDRYDAFVKAHGPINESDGLSLIRRAGDPFAEAIAGLERFQAGKWQPREIFERNVMRGRRVSENPTIADAYAMARNESLSIDVARVAELAKSTEAEVVDALFAAGQLFRTPAGVYEPADVYLSGHVRAKLRAAIDAREEGVEGMDRNIEALEKVIPEGIPYFQIEAKIGATWVTADDYNQFVRHLLNSAEGDVTVTRVPRGWRVNVENEGVIRRAEATSTWGTPAISWKKILFAAMNNGTVSIKYKDDDGVMRVAEEPTRAANAKVEAIRDEFKQWIWQDAQRAVRLEAAYNEIFNGIATPQYDGSHLTFEGLVLNRGDSPFDLRQHQINAIWRGVVTGRGLYAHEVGTGKTLVMAGLVMESRRLGKAKKPLILAHNANARQVAKEIQGAYPGARILFVDNLSAATRQATLNQIALDDWDAVVMPHSVIDRMQLRPESIESMMAAEIAELEIAAMEAAEEDNVDLSVEDMDDPDKIKRLRSPTAKELVKEREKIKARIEKARQLADKADAVFFEDLGVDMIVVDEAHIFKKLPVATSQKLKGLNKSSSQRALMLDLVTKFVKGNNGGHGIHLFTGTPVTNTLNEVYNMMRYMMDDVMQRDGVAAWDAWFNTFADSTSEVELNSASEWEPVERLAAFVNLPELRQMVGQYLDTVFADDMPEFQPRESPEGRTEDAIGRPFKKVVNVISAMSPQQAAHKAELQERYQRWKRMTGREKKKAMASGAPEVPIMIEGEGVKAALDYRLIDREADFNPEGKVGRCIDNVMIHHAEHPKATQMIFMQTGYSDYAERSTGQRTADGKTITERVPVFNIAKAMKEELISRGLTADEIVIFSDLNAEQRKLAAEKMQRGEIRVAIGSTETMGTGVNAQTEMRAMHHLDAPWMPGDLEQRNGRGWRQGNRWNTVIEYRYITEGSHDGRRWQILLTKDRFIKKFMRADSSVRVIEGDGADIDDEGGGGNFEETFSAAAGDPRILVKEKLARDVNKLLEAQRRHFQAIAEAKKKAVQLTDDNGRLAGAIPEMERDAAAYDRAKEAPFSIEIGNKTFTDRELVDDALLAAFERVAPRERVVLARYRGFTIEVGKNMFGAISDPVAIGEGRHPFNAASLGSIEYALRSIRDRIARRQATIETNTRSIASLDKLAETPFGRQKDLDRKREMLVEITRDLEQNPVPSPSWLRNGAPIGTSVWVDGVEHGVAGHRSNEEGHQVLVEASDGSVRAVPYLSLTNESGLPVFEDLLGNGRAGSVEQIDNETWLNFIDQQEGRGPLAMGIARAAAETDTAPTEAQKAAGNYRKGKVTIQGLRISIENPRGSQRTGTDRSGKAWSVTMPHHYGYFLGTEGRDKDHVDVFIGPDPENPVAYVVNQVNPETKRFDEHKVMLGFPDRKSAIEGYRGSYSPGWKGLSTLVEVPVPSLRAWLDTGDMKKPLRAQDVPSVEGPALANGLTGSADGRLTHSVDLPTLQTGDGRVLAGPGTFTLAMGTPVYHGTPHKVDRFSLDRIGTGEGAQAYGWGLYFTETYGIAKAYRDKLGTTTRAHLTIDGVKVNDKTLTAILKDHPDPEVRQAAGMMAPHLKSIRLPEKLDERIGRRESELADFRQRLGERIDPANRSVQFSWTREMYEDRIAGIEGEIRSLQKLRALARRVDEKTSGNIYTVRLKPEEDEFLDWDKPLSDQTETIRRRIMPLIEQYRSEMPPGFDPDRLQGGGVLRVVSVANNRIDDRIGSERLLAAGIRGIRYLDGSSRGSGSGTYNYVIFDENDIEILEENGVPVSLPLPLSPSLSMGYSREADDEAVIRESLDYFSRDLPTESDLDARRAEFEARVSAAGGEVTAADDLEITSAILREAYMEDRRGQTHEHWFSAAEKLIRKDSEGVVRALLEAAREDRPIESPTLVKASQILVPRIMAEAMASRDPQQIRDAMALQLADYKTGTAASLTLGARRRRYKHNRDKHRDLILSLIAKIPPKVVAESKAAPTPREKSAEINRLKAELRRFTQSGIVEKYDAALAEIAALNARLRNTRDKAEVDKLKKKIATQKGIADRLRADLASANALNAAQAEQITALEDRIERAKGAGAAGLAEIERLRREIENVKRLHNASQANARESIRRLGEALGAARKQRDRAEVIGEAHEARLARVEEVLRDMGLTLHDLFSGQAVARLRGSEIVARVIDEHFSAPQRAAIRFSLPPEGMTPRQIAEKTGITRTAIPEILTKFRGLIEARFLELAKRGLTLRDFQMSEEGGLFDLSGRIGDKGEMLPRPGLAMAAAAIPLDQATRAAKEMVDALFGGITIDAGGKVRPKSQAKPFDLDSRVDTAQVARVMQIAVDGNRYDMVFEAWINNILSGPQTHAVNFAGNALNLVLEYGLQRWMEAGFNAMIGDKGGATFGEYRELIGAIPRAWADAKRRAKETWLTEESFLSADFLREPVEVGTAQDKSGGGRRSIPDRIGRIGTAGAKDLVAASKDFVTGKGWKGASVGKTVRIPGRALLFMDTLFKGVVANIEVAGQAYRAGRAKGLTGEELRQYIDEEVNLPGSSSAYRAMVIAEEMTFTAPLRGSQLSARDVEWNLQHGTNLEPGGLFEQLVKKIQDARQGDTTLSPLAAAVIGWFFPFIQTPFNIYKAGLRRTPLGLVGVGSRLLRSGLVSWKSGRPFLESYGKARMARDLTDQTIGLLITGILFGLVEGDGDDDDTKPILITGTRPYGVASTGERELADRMEGGPTTIRLGTGPDAIRFDYGRLEPFATILASVADGVRSIKRMRDGAAKVDEMAKFHQYVLSQATDKTFLQGIVKLGELIEPSTSAGNNVARAVAQFIVPNLVRQPLRLTDDYVRQNKTAPWWYHAFPMGGLAEPKHDLYGQPIRKGQTPLTPTADPVQRLARVPIDTGLRPAPVPHVADIALRNWNRLNPDKGDQYFPPGNSITSFKDMAGQKQKLTAAQLAEVERIGGTRLRVELARAITPAEAANPTEATIEKIRAARARVFSQARDEVVKRPAPAPKRARTLSEMLGWTAPK